MLNEPLLKATLLVILDGQATLYATIMTQGIQQEDYIQPYHKYVDEYKKKTAELIIEAMTKAQNEEASNGQK